MTYNIGKDVMSKRDILLMLIGGSVYVATRALFTVILKMYIL